MYKQVAQFALIITMDYSKAERYRGNYENYSFTK